jgi:hypothetical protein
MGCRGELFVPPLAGETDAAPGPATWRDGTLGGATVRQIAKLVNITPITVEFMMVYGRDIYT